jgi:predicted dehydrogenase
MLTRRDLGPLRAIECRWLGQFAERYVSGSTHRRYVGWGDGVALDTASHVIDTIAFLGVGPLAVTRASLTTGRTGADIAANVGFTVLPGGPRVSIAIEDHDGAEEWTIIITGRDGELRVTRQDLTGIVQGRTIAEAAYDLRRPVEDLLALAAGQHAYGATLSEAVAVLALIDEIRKNARRRHWHRPRAKALGRLNGAC